MSIKNWGLRNRKKRNPIKELYNNLGFSHKLMIFCFGIVVIPAVILTMLYTNQISNVLEKQSIENATYELEQAKDNLKGSIALVEELSNQISFNSTLSKELTAKYENKGEAAAVYVDIIKPLLDPQLSLHRDLINGITIYIYNEDFLVDNKYIAYIDEDIKATNWYKQCTLNSTQSEIYWKYKQDKAAPAYILYRNLNNYLGEPSGIIEIEVNRSFLASSAVVDNQDFWILLEDISNSDKPEFVEDQSYPEFIDDVLAESSGSYDIAEEGQRNRIVYSSFNSRYSPYRWKTIASIPVDLLMEDVNKAKQNALFIGLFAAIVLIIIIVIYAKGLTRRIDHLADQTSKVMNGTFNISVDVEGKDEIGQLGHSFNEMLKYMDNLVNEVYENKIKIQDSQLLQRETELKALQNKINPHFLYNTLDALRFKAIIAGNEDLGDMMVSLSRLLSYSINNKSDIVTLDKEVEHVTSYIMLMKARYEDKLQFEIDIDESLYNCKINKLTLQPLVENSIYHGIRPLNATGHIRITAAREGDMLIIKVCDDGKGMSKERVKEVNSFKIKSDDEHKIGIGMENVNDRIKLFFGDEYGLKVESELGNGTDVIIQLPYLEDGDDNA